MTKIYMRTLAVAFVCLLAFGCFGIAVSAEIHEKELGTISSTKNIAITVTYDAEPPTVEFIAPNGDVYGSQAVAEGKMTKTDSGKALFFRIPRAQAGTWLIRYDKKSNTNVEVSYAPYAESLSIESFNFTKVDESTLKVKFLVSHSTDLYYSYKIYAVITENGSVSGQKEIAGGSADANETKEISVSIDKLTSYSNYQLMLEVTGNENGIEVFDSIVSESTFGYTDPYASEAPENFYVEMDAANESLLINWENTQARNRETMVAVFIDDAAEPAYHNTFTSDIKVTEVSIPLSSAKTVRVDLSYKDYYDKTSLVASRTINMSVAKAVKLNCSETTTAAQAEIAYNLGGLSGPFKAILNVNETTQELSLQGNSSFSVSLEAFDNKVSLIWYLDEYTAFKVGGDIYSDRLAPSLNIPDVIGIVKVKSSTYVLSGTVDPGCTVTVNGVAVDVDANGIFTVKYDVAIGENIFDVVAKNANGNSTQQTVVVERIEPGAIKSEGRFGAVLQFIPLIIAAVAAIAATMLFFSLKKKYAKINAENSKRAATYTVLKSVCLFLAVAAVITAVAFVVMLVLILMKLNSAEFYDIVVTDGVAAGYEMIRTRNGYIIGIVVSVVCAAVFIALRILFSKRMKKPAKAKAPKQPKQPKQPDVPNVPNTPNIPGLPDPPKFMGSSEYNGWVCACCGTKNKAGTKFCMVCGSEKLDK